MNTHKNARLTFARRLELVMDVLERDLTLCAAAAAHNVSVPTARKWVGRYLAEGESGLADRSSRPRRSPRSIGPSKALAIVELRRRRLIQGRIAASLDPPLQLASPSSGHRGPRANQSPGSVQKQPLDASHLYRLRKIRRGAQF
jgi:transposase-like protein